MTRAPLDKGLHPRNRFRDGYDFEALVATFPRLAEFVAPNAFGNASVNFADPAAVKTLNQALLAHAYGLAGWDFPKGALCPPIPGRSDHLHYVADLLASDVSGAKTDPVPRGPSVSVLDIGTGANCIYPLIGASEYGWRFVATETDPDACAWAAHLVEAQPTVSELIVCRQQLSPLQCFEGVVQPGEQFDLCLSNPPFHASAEEAALGNLRKRRNLARGSSKRPAKQRPSQGSANDAESTTVSDSAAASDRNFAGRPSELWCPGGELAFVQRMITESAQRPELCRWFTSLVSKRSHLAQLTRDLKAVKAVDITTLDMAHGQKQSRLLAWSFQSPTERRREH
ncbi:MAG: 23S rRNA (adenine1618-N6)-methyltransferase [Pseudohongiellaceae bacterium]|jgi:23S rRNA (adenine1618-N6)-methyltransferase